MKSGPTAATAALLALATPATAADFYTGTFGPADAAEALCFARSYDDAHKQAHPRQKVTQILLAMETENADGRRNTPDDFQLRVGVNVRATSERYIGHAYCKAGPTDAQCFLEGDGGRLTLKRTDDGRLRLEVGAYGLAFEGSDFLQIGADDSDDNVFLLDAAPKDTCADKDDG